MISHNIVTEYISVFILAFVFVFSITPWVIKLAQKMNFVDNPEARKIHKTAIPLMGGISVFIGFIALVIYDVVIVSNRTFNIRLIGYLLGAFIIVIVGVIDDKRGMRPIVKLIGQFLACSTFIFTNFGSVTWLAIPFTNDLTFPMLLLNNTVMFNNFISIPILFIWMIGLMNATNFLDNMDGMISGISAIIALGFFAFAMIINPDNSSSAMWLSLMGLLSLSYAGSVLGFLPYNFNPAKIFLGDAGSMFIGYFISSMGILMANFASLQFQSKWFYLLPVILISYAIFDICFVSITRKKDGRLVWQGGKDHTTHRMKNLLGSVKVTTLLIYAINVVIVILTIMVTLIGRYELLLSILAICIVCYYLLGKRLYSIEVEIPDNQLKKKRIV
ncbi:undecaprenyl/decaprenyl-phosphate alpha-N-acetylglucosaminyl 1-phosphate transferase [bacterium]|nr:undecaprenyl/decaprenyl-phosphate alpha-N-acetylglucosaminyl 1-phosphate transferase [bacterium]